VTSGIGNTIIDATVLSKQHGKRGNIAKAFMTLTYGTNRGRAADDKLIAEPQAPCG
jgi:hypothetical protein